MYQKMMFYVYFAVTIATVEIQAADQPLPRTGRCNWGVLTTHLRPERRKYSLPETIHVPTEIVAAYQHCYGQVTPLIDKTLYTTLAIQLTRLMSGQAGLRSANDENNDTFGNPAESFDSVIAYFPTNEIAPTVLNLPSSEILRIKCLGGTTVVIKRSWVSDEIKVILFQPKLLKLSSSKSSDR